MITNQQIAVIRKMFANTKAKTDPLVIAQHNPAAHPRAADIVAAQNVLRDCISVVFNECMPIDRAFIAEMAVRLASYVVSVAPVEDQDVLARAIASGFEEAHRSRIAKGIGIEAQWITDGVEHPNMPTKGNTQ